MPILPSATSISICTGRRKIREVMKNFLLILFVFCVSVGNAQITTHELEDFNRVKIYNGLSVKLIESDSNRAEITGKSREKVRFKIDDGELKIRVSIDNIWDEDDTEVNLYYAKIQVLDARQNASVRFENEVKQEELTLNASEASDIFARVQLKLLNADVTTGATIEIEGESDIQEVNINTGGKFYAKNHLSIDTNIRISAGGVGDISASGEVVAKVRAGGTVNVYGNPKYIEEDTLFGGKVIKKN